MLLAFFKGDSTASLWFSRPRASSRSVTLHLRDHGRIAAGTVQSQGFVGCRITVPVIIERRRQHGWSRLRRIRTRESGRYRATLTARAGSYRARLPARSVGAASDRPCLAATSAAVRLARR